MSEFRKKSRKIPVSRERMLDIEANLSNVLAALWVAKNDGECSVGTLNQIHQQVANIHRMLKKELEENDE